MKKRPTHISLTRLATGAFALMMAASVPTWADTPTGASFLTINPSARLTGLGGSGDPNTTDISSVFGNPAGLSQNRASEIAASHTDLFEDDSFDTFAASLPLGDSPANRTLAVGFLYLNNGTMERRADDRSEAGTFKASDAALQLSYAQKHGRTNVGLSVKTLQQRIAGNTATGVALDVGAQRPIAFDGLSLGMAVKNLGPSMKFDSEKFALPLITQIGLVYALKNLNLFADSNIPLREGKSTFSLGAEFLPVRALALRGGYTARSDRGLSGQKINDHLSEFAGLCAGVGLRLGRYQLDYAMSPHEELGLTQQISFSMRLK